MQLPRLEAEVTELTTTAPLAAEQLLKAFSAGKGHPGHLEALEQ